MKTFIKKFKAVCINYVIAQLQANKKELAKNLASKIDIPLISEKDEIELAEGILSVVEDVIKDLGKK